MKHNSHEPRRQQPAQPPGRQLPLRYRLIWGTAAVLAVAGIVIRIPLIPDVLAAAALATLVSIAAAAHQAFGWGRRKADTYRGWRAHGWATPYEMWRHLSARAVRRRGKWTHPHMTRYRRQPAELLGVMIGRHWRRKVIGSVEQFYLMISPPRTIKSLWLAAVLLCWQGPAVAASTRIDIMLDTVKARMRLGGYLWILNPDQLGGIRSTVRWSPLSGCTDPDVAHRTAAIFAEHGPQTSDMKASEFWDSAGFLILRCMIYAAALDGRDIRQARMWCLDPRADEPAKIIERDGRAPDWADELRTLHSLGGDTLAVAATQAAGCLAWLASPEMTWIACPPVGEGIDLAGFMHGRDTIYMIAEDVARSTAAPFFAAFTSALYHTAKAEAALQPRARLAKKLLLQLDEATNICKVDAPRIGSQAGGWGVTFMLSAQTPPALLEAWGERGGRTIWDNAVKIIGPGFDDPERLEQVSAAVGTHDRYGDQDARGDRILPISRIRSLKAPKGILLYRSVRPAIIRLHRVSDLPGYDEATIGEAAGIFTQSAGLADARRAATAPAETLTGTAA